MKKISRGVNDYERKAVATNPYPHKFTLIFDREGYSPEFMARMKAKQVAVLT